MADDEKAVTLEDLDARLRGVEALQDLILRLLAMSKPLDKVLELYGATETQARVFYALLDDMAMRAKGRESDRPTLAYFELKLGDIFPALRRDAEFVAVVIDTLKIERPAYRELHAYIAASR